MASTRSKKQQVTPASSSGRVDPGSLLLVLYVLVLLVVLLWGGIARGESIGQPQLPRDLRQGTLLLPNGAGRPVPATLLAQEAHLTISGIVGRVRVSQQFQNSGNDWVDAIYVFPLPDESSVDRLRMVVGEREIVGVIKEKEEARKIHEQARQEGKKSSLLSQNRANIFTTRVANIAPGETVTIHIEYQQLVSLRDGTFSLRFPMAITPRYLPGRPLVGENRARLGFSDEGWAVATDQVPDGATISPFLAPQGTEHEPTMMLSVDLDSGFDLDHLASLYHEMEIRRLAVGQHQLAFTGRALADRDFVLEWRPRRQDRAAAALFAERVGEDRYLLLMLMPPYQPPPTPAPREVIFVLDVSGSMSGSSIRQAKAALVEGLAGLRPEDSFNIISFSDHASSLFRGSRSGASHHLAAARRYLGSLQAGGGTEMREALELALTGASETGRLRQVVFLTDGAVANEDALLSLIHQRLGDSRLFPVAIGSAPNSYFMARAATVGRGSHTAIGKADEVAERMRSLLQRLERPVVTDLKIQAMSEGVTVEGYPALVPDLYWGEPLLVAMKISGGDSALHVAGRQQGQPWAYFVDTAHTASRPGIAQLWARKKIRDARERLVMGADGASIREEILTVALRYGLVSDYTSLVAVDTQPSRPQNLAGRREFIPGAVPRGLDIDAVFGGGAQTATPALLQLLLGACCLLLALVLQTMGRRRWPRPW